jgi:hypothetical protein
VTDLSELTTSRLNIRVTHTMFGDEHPISIVTFATNLTAVKHHCEDITSKFMKK